MMFRYLLILAILPCLSCNQISTNKQDSFNVNNRVIAHRGAWKSEGLPQNSVASLQHAISLGVAGSEFDLHLTADEIIVSNHDHDLKGINIEQTNYSDLLIHKLVNGETLPTFESFLELGMKQKNTKLIAELKPSGISKDRSLLLAQKVINMVNQVGAKEWMVYISFDYEILKEIIRLDKTAKTMYLKGDVTPDQLNADGIWGMDYHYGAYNKNDNWIAEAQELGLKVNAWTVNKVAVMDGLLDVGIDYITTDEPETLLDKVNNTGYCSDWKLVWSEEFDYSGLPDTTKWNYQIGGHGWGNNEKQYYTESDLDNAIVENGVLKIIARKEAKENMGYTSSRLTTKNKGDWKYGKFEIQAKLPKGRGLWPAIWMLPTNWEYGNWPASGEIDIMEHVGYIPDSIYQTVHTKSFNHMIGTQVGNAIKVDQMYDDFHTYGIVWDENKIDFYINGHKRHSFANRNKTFAEWPFDQDFHMILNLAIGGNWGGRFGIDDTIFPATFEVDYVRAFKK